MAEATKIQWCDHSASPWHGCSEVHAGCDNCYARTMAKRNPATLGVWGANGTRVRSATFSEKCRRWNAQAEKAGVVRSVFPSICDPFEDWQGPILDARGQKLGYTNIKYPFWPYYVIGAISPEDGRLVTMADLRRDLFATIDACQWLRFLLLTKRPDNVLRMWPSADMFDPESEHKAYWSNVWLLTSVSDQLTAYAMIPELLKCRDLCPVLGVSLEPMLGPVVLPQSFLALGQRAWVIVGGESGQGARPCDAAWVRSIIKQCKAASVPVFTKQLGAYVVDRNDAGFEAEHWTYADGPNAGLPVEIGAWPTPERIEHDLSGYRDGYQGAPVRVHLSDKKGGDPAEWPADLRVRELPEGR